MMTESNKKTEVDKSLDLPLMANIEDIAVKHYSIQLTCHDIESRKLSGTVRLQVFGLKEESLSGGCDKIILDCCDIVVHFVDIQLSCQEEIVSLNFEQTDWALIIECPTYFNVSSKDKNRGNLIMIKYETKPDTRSLHWRLDADDNVCVYTAAAAVNNRGLFPCQDVPGSMSTWDFTMCLPLQSSHKVFCTGDEHAEITETASLRQFKFKTDMVLPMSTFALAVGDFDILDFGNLDVTSSYNGNFYESVPIRLIGCRSDMSRMSPVTHQYITAALKSATEILGPYPLPKLDIVIVSQYFSGLGLASPNLIFLSPSIFPPKGLEEDLSFLIKISHELCHSWFGILIGAKDWSEVWLSEGFATFLEDYVHHRALAIIGRAVPQALINLRAFVRLKSLCEEVDNVAEDLQELRPMKGKKLTDQSDDDTTSYVKHGMNPEAGLTQSHYLKGFFMLHHLKQIMEGEQCQTALDCDVVNSKFLNLIRKYFSKYKGELVDSTCFLSMFFDCQKLSDCRDENVMSIMHSWLDNPGLPSRINLLTVHQCSELSLYKNVLDVKQEILQLSKCAKKNDSQLELYSTELIFSEQVVILFDQLLEASCDHRVLNIPLMKLLRRTYDKFILTNPDVGHLWCELVLVNRARCFYKDVESYLLNHQCMGVYLYSELAATTTKSLNKLLSSLYARLKDNLDPSMKSVIQGYLPV